MGAGPGGNFISDVEIRYAIGRNDPGCTPILIFEHQPKLSGEYAGRGPICTKLDDMFDWMSVGPKWNRPYPKAPPGDTKISTTSRPSNTKIRVRLVEHHEESRLLAHQPERRIPQRRSDQGRVPLPSRHERRAAACVLNYWRSSHYGGASVAVAEGEHWTKVIGPFFLYVNSGRRPAGAVQRCGRASREGSQAMAVRLGRGRRLSARE